MVPFFAFLQALQPGPSPAFSPSCASRTSQKEGSLTHSHPLLSPEALPPPSLGPCTCSPSFCRVHSQMIRPGAPGRQRPCLDLPWSLGPALGLNTQRMLSQGKSDGGRWGQDGVQSVAQLCLTLCDPNGLQHARPPCPSPTPGVY